MCQHLGHARNYVSTDITRRILRDYFKFNVKFVMNITDVDDKIILAARQQHFLQLYTSRNPTVDDQVRKDTNAALEQYLQNHLPLIAADTIASDIQSAIDQKYGHVIQGKSVANDATPPSDKEAKVKMYLKIVQAAADALISTDPHPTQFYAKVGGILLPYLDLQYKSTIDSKDHGIFTTLTKEYENRFFEDMAALNVERPDELTRVTEYGPQIVAFVKQIQNNGFAYEHEGSIYYDTKAWEANGGFYARLEPWSKHNADLQADGEGALSKGQTSFKKSMADFALWKKSRPGEPGWDSPWGLGRPGWHIECSAMASDVLGRQFDIHSGGIDLAFPHHDNEIAQSEAYWHESGRPVQQWVNYFIHMGHLGIQGAKMSKSLKNFITVREALEKGDWTPRSLRIAFLSGGWKNDLEITPQVINAGNAWEDKITNFFLKARDVQSRPLTEASEKEGLRIRLAHAATEAKVKHALCDSFDTATVMDAMSELVTLCNKEATPPSAAIIDVAKWLTFMVNIFGLDATPDTNMLGWSGIEVPEEAASSLNKLAALRETIRNVCKGRTLDESSRNDIQSALNGLSMEEDGPIAAVYDKVLQKFYGTIKTVLTETDPMSASQEMLKACDEVRDVDLWNIGLWLEDRETQKLPPMVRPLTRSVRQERKDREQLAALKLERQEKLIRDAQERLEKAKIDPREMFKTAEYSTWDSEGMPTKDKDGNEVTKSKLKKLVKDQEKQRRLYEEYQRSNNNIVQ